MQIIIGTLMLAISSNAEEFMNHVRWIFTLFYSHLTIPTAIGTHILTIRRVHYACYTFRDARYELCTDFRSLN